MALNVPDVNGSYRGGTIAKYFFPSGSFAIPLYVSQSSFGDLWHMMRDVAAALLNAAAWYDAKPLRRQLRGCGIPARTNARVFSSRYCRWFMLHSSGCDHFSH